MDSRKPMGAGEIEELKRISADYDKHGVEWKEAMFALNALPRLLSMLTPPPDAAVREAVERLSAGVNGPWEGAGTMFADIRTLLRAVQAPRLTGDAVRWVQRAHDACADPSRPRQAVGEMLAAWLEKFGAGEVGRGE